MIILVMRVVHIALCNLLCAMVNDNRIINRVNAVDISIPDSGIRRRL